MEAIYSSESHWTFTGLRGVTSQKIVPFIVTSMGILDSKEIYLFVTYFTMLPQAYSILCQLTGLLASEYWIWNRRGTECTRSNVRRLFRLWSSGLYLDSYQSFEGTYCIHLQGWSVWDKESTKLYVYIIGLITPGISTYMDIYGRRYSWSNKVQRGARFESRPENKFV
jgi:hypothetical protein